jgi:uncharacterized membrane protein
MTAVVAVIAFACSGVLGACSSTTPSAASGADAAPSCDPAATPTNGDLPEAVNAVLADKCQACHTSPPKNHAPWPLLSFEETQVRFGITEKRRWQRMAEVIEPGGSPHMPFGNAPQLTADQLATLRAWFAGCAMPIAEGSGHDLHDDGTPGG